MWRPPCVRATAMIEAGADILDVGGESTRPGADPVAPAEERDRTASVVEALVQNLGVPVSIDTRRAAVAEASLDAGAVIINDVSAFRDPEMAPLAARRKAVVILMHMAGEPRTMQESPEYGDVVAEVKDFLLKRAAFAESCGIPGGDIWIDPGIGFGKLKEHNIRLIRKTDVLAAAGYPVVMALSRKRVIGDITGRPVEERLTGTVLANYRALQLGASVIRVHDVEAAADTVALFRALG